MNEIDCILNSLNRIAMVEGMVMPIMEGALKSSQIMPGVEKYAGDAKNLHELWVNNYGDKFFKMGTFIRLGSEIESGFRRYYMYKKSHSNNQDLISDTAVKAGVFQRLKGRDTLQMLYQNELSVDLETISSFQKLKEFMVARHLYTHRAGLLDEKFVDEWKILTGVDLKSSPDIINTGYPAVDAYWFEPLKNIWEYQKASISTFKSLPA